MGLSSWEGARAPWSGRYFWNVVSSNPPWWTGFRGRKRAVVLGRFKYIEAPEEGTRELYDLISGPREIQNLVEARPADARRVAALLSERAAAPGAERPYLSAEVAERLRALGYVQ